VNVYASSKNVSVSAAVRHPALFKKLMLVRDEICNRDQKPIYMVANTKSLTEMSNYLPATAADLMMISGFGKAKADAYGEEFLSVVREYMEEHQLESTISEFPDKRSKKVKKEKAARNPTSASSYHLFREGLSIDQIAAERNLTRETIEKHLIPYIANGELELSGLVNPGDQQLIVEALSGFKKEGGLTAVKNRLPEHISYSDIRFVMAGRLQTLVQ
jgi:uncharacterized protein YpbB